jgi:hypothetical protein
VPPCEDRCPHAWHMPGQYGFLIEEVRPMAFSPVRGSLNFFEANVPLTVMRRADRIQ